MKDEEIQHLALEVLVLVTRNQDCVNSIAEAKVTVTMVLVTIATITTIGTIASIATLSSKTVAYSTTLKFLNLPLN